MKKLYEKNELNFALIWIGIYVVAFSLGENISAAVGVAKCVTTPLCVIMTGILYYWIRQSGLQEKYGLCKMEGTAKSWLYFIPLVLLASTNMWGGLRMNLTVLEAVLHVISMIGVGFLEEIIFRGLLFKAMSKTNVKSAILVSSLTFGMGHIVNLLNGREVLETLLQLCYAIAIGFVFVIIFYVGKSLWPCIIAHAVINCLSAFSNQEIASVSRSVFAAVFLCVVSFGYAAYILKKHPVKISDGK